MEKNDIGGQNEKRSDINGNFLLLGFVCSKQLCPTSTEDDKGKKDV
jgi:hypothetical protein